MTSQKAFRARVLLMAFGAAPGFCGDLGTLAPAFYNPGPYRGDDPRLHVFPADAKAFTVPLPFQFSALAVSPDGKSLYASKFVDPRLLLGPRLPNLEILNTGLYRIELGTAQAAALRGSEGMGSVDRVAASSAVIVASARRFSGGSVSECGLYELVLLSGHVRRIMASTDCRSASSWGSLSLSPDGQKVIAVREHRLELIDSEAGSSRSLGDGFNYASWSPDGRWIAALRSNGDQTILIDPLALSKQRELPASEAIWSPDSRSLLASRPRRHCSSDFGTLYLVDIETGTASSIESSACEISHPVFGWVDAPH